MLELRLIIIISVLNSLAITSDVLVFVLFLISILH